MEGNREVFYVFGSWRVSVEVGVCTCCMSACVHACVCVCVRVLRECKGWLVMRCNLRFLLVRPHTPFIFVWSSVPISNNNPLTIL